MYVKNDLTCTSSPNILFVPETMDVHSPKMCERCVSFLQEFGLSSTELSVLVTSEPFGVTVSFHIGDGGLNAAEPKPIVVYHDHQGATLMDSMVCGGSESVNRSNPFIWTGAAASVCHVSFLLRVGSQPSS